MSAHDIIAKLDGDVHRIAQGRHHDPHAVLGAHEIEGSLVVLVHLPTATQVRLDRRHDTRRVAGTDFFVWRGARCDLPRRYCLSWIDAHGATFEQFDPYCFAPAIAPDELARFASGNETSAWRCLGAHLLTIDGVPGVRFSVWAPDAARVSVVGAFCLLRLSAFCCDIRLTRISRRTLIPPYPFQRSFLYLRTGEEP